MVDTSPVDSIGSNRYQFTTKFVVQTLDDAKGKPSMEPLRGSMTNARQTETANCKDKNYDDIDWKRHSFGLPYGQLCAQSSTFTLTQQIEIDLFALAKVRRRFV